LFVTLATAQLSLVTGVPRLTLVAVQAELAATIKSAGQRIVGFSVSVTVTVKVQLLWLPFASVAVLVTVVVPTGNVLPLAGLLATFATLQLSVALTVKVTLRLHWPASAASTTLGGQRMVGGVVSTTVTTWLRFVLFPHPSSAVQVRVMMLVGPTTLVTVTTVGVSTPRHASVNTGAVKFGAAGHCIVAFAPCAVVTAGAVVSTTVSP
jgi:hypothetical protein